MYLCCVSLDKQVAHSSNGMRLSQEKREKERTSKATLRQARRQQTIITVRGVYVCLCSCVRYTTQVTNNMRALTLIHTHTLITQFMLCLYSFARPNHLWFVHFIILYYIILRHNMNTLSWKICGWSWVLANMARAIQPNIHCMGVNMRACRSVSV